MNSFVQKDRKSLQTNPEQLTTNYSDVQKKNFGIINILSRFKSNSSIICFPSWFADLTKQFQDKINNQVRYCGNCSDLWGLLSFQLKAIGSLLIENNLDITLTKKNAELGQIFMLYKTEPKVQHLQAKLQIKIAYIEKLTKFRQQIITIKSIHAKRSQLSQIQDQEKNKQYYFKANQLLSQNFSQNNQQKIKTGLKEYLKNLLKIMNNSKGQAFNEKTKLIISLICMQLLFVLRNLNWKKLCLSNFNISHYILRFLPEPHGATKIAKYLHDATEILLREQFQTLKDKVLN